MIDINARIVNVADGQVTFRYKDYADDARSKTLALSGEEILRRFVQHNFKEGFMRLFDHSDSGKYAAVRE